MADDSFEQFTGGYGCYWGSEKFFKKDFQKLFPDSVRNIKVGFMGGSAVNPTYREVCTQAQDENAHVEVVTFEYDTSKATIEDVIRFGFRFHDPTTTDSQGNDKGKQYASVIFYHTEEQKAAAEKIKAEVQAAVDDGTITAYAKDTVVTEIRPASEFYPGPDDHQEYLDANPNGYCNHRLRY